MKRQLKRNARTTVCLCCNGEYRTRISISALCLEDSNSDYDDLQALFYRMQNDDNNVEMPSYRPLHRELCEKIRRRSLRETEAISMRPARCLAPVSLGELKLGPLLGMGGFSKVYAVQSVNATSKHQSFTKDEILARRSLTNSTKNGRLDESRLAVKVLKRKLLANPKKFANAAIDLITEAAFLNTLSHPNIIKIRGFASAGVDAYNSGRHDGFFMVVDRLNETLEHRIVRWRRTYRQLGRGRVGKVLFGDKSGGKKRSQLMLERLRVALEIARGLEYLHNNGLIFRDLKPCNVGFDVFGTAKIFDFGLCRELPSVNRTDKGHDESYRMSGGVGTYHYMAPEVRSSSAYNQKADVYSFGVLLHEMLSLNRPVVTKRRKTTREEGVPDEVDIYCPMCSCWPSEITDLLTRMLSTDASSRPNSNKVCESLKTAITSLENAEPLECVTLSKKKKKQQGSNDTVCGNTLRSTVRSSLSRSVKV